MNSLSSAPSSERISIAFLGCTNSGKSSLINAFTCQEVSIVSSVKGTTTDPVRKAMELLPLGPVMLWDTPGIDDKTELGNLRIKRTYDILSTTNIAVVVIDGTHSVPEEIPKLISQLERKSIPFIIVYNKCDLAKPLKRISDSLCLSAKTGDGIEELKSRIVELYTESKKPVRLLIEDLVHEKNVVLLITPIDASAPKGRIILPQVQVIRAALDAHAVCIEIQPEELPLILTCLKNPPDLIITDSQVFGKIKNIVPNSIPLTSFSILMARYKGVLDEALKAMDSLKQLTNGDHILIAEGCTHHRQCGDIGTVKLPAWIRSYAGCEPKFSFTSGDSFPESLTGFAMVIHCGGCMLSENEIVRRRDIAARDNVPFANFGMVIAETSGLLERSMEVFKR